jgi:hypothetical protein
LGPNGQGEHYKFRPVKDLPPVPATFGAIVFSI